MAQAVAHKARPHLTECGSATQDGVVRGPSRLRARQLEPAPDARTSVNYWDVRNRRLGEVLQTKVTASLLGVQKWLPEVAGDTISDNLGVLGVRYKPSDTNPTSPSPCTDRPMLPIIVIDSEDGAV